MDVLLLDPGAANAATWTIGLLRMPIKMALLQLLSFLRDRQDAGEPCLAGARVRVCDLEWELEQPNDPEAYRAYLDAARARLDRETFDVVAVSCWSSLKYRLAMDVAALCRARNPAAVIVVGGWHPSALPSDFLGEGSPFDAVVTGEGEWALLDLLRRVDRGERPRGEILPGRLVVPHEEVPLRWSEYPWATEVPTVPIFFSRGCPFVCNYCMEPYTKGQSWRALPVPRALERVRHLLHETRARYIDVHDPIFAPQPAWRRGFFEGLAEMGFDRFLWTESRVDTFNPGDLELLSRFDLQLDFGLETASVEMLGIMKKTQHPLSYLKRAKETLQAASRYDLASQVYLITHHPGERLHQVKETLSFLDDVTRDLGRTSLLQISAQPYRYYPGTAVGREGAAFFEAYGTVVDRPGWWREDTNMRDASACVVDTKLSADERRAIDETWEVGLAKLNERLARRRSERASRILALRSASYLDLALWRERWRLKREAQGEAGAPWERNQSLTTG